MLTCTSSFHMFCTSCGDMFELYCFFLQTIPVTSSGIPISDRPFTRTSLLGFVGPVSMIYFWQQMLLRDSSASNSNRPNLLYIPIIN